MVDDWAQNMPRNETHITVSTHFPLFLQKTSILNPEKAKLLPFLVCYRVRLKWYGLR